MRRWWVWPAAIVVCCLALAARADDAPAPTASTAQAASSQIGRSIFVVNDVDGQAGDAPAQHIAVNDDILFGEDVTTGSDAKTVLEFRDGSTFEIGPDAAVRIDAFVFNPEESTSHKAISVTRGVFRYVSGYVANDQLATIATPHGQMGIRGSVAEGVVDPAVPDFVFLGEGSATFSNAAGNVDLQPGNAIAVPSATTSPMAPTAMPPAVAAQALQAIDKRLPPRTVLANRPAADEAWLKRAGVANLVPASEQRGLSAPARPLPAPAGRSGIAGELGLLTEGNRIGLFNGRQAARTPEQTAFLTRAAHDNPNAAATLRRFTAEARVTHSANVTAGTTLVIRGVAHAAPSAEVMRRVTAASVRANPGAAALITRHANEAVSRPDRGGPARPPAPSAEHPARRAPDVHPPNDVERKEFGGNPHTPPGQQERRGAAPPQQRPTKPGAPNATPPKRPAKPPAKGPPPKKKDDERDPNQR